MSFVESEFSFVQVDSIIGERKGKSGETEYLVKWDGYSSEWDTWEPESNLKSVAYEIKQYQKVFILVNIFLITISSFYNRKNSFSNISTTIYFLIL